MKLWKPAADEIQKQEKVAGFKSISDKAMFYLTNCFVLMAINWTISHLA